MNTTIILFAINKMRKYFEKKKKMNCIKKFFALHYSKLFIYMCTYIKKFLQISIYISIQIGNSRFEFFFFFFLYRSISFIRIHQGTNNLYNWSACNRSLPIFFFLLCFFVQTQNTFRKII